MYKKYHLGCGGYADFDVFYGCGCILKREMTGYLSHQLLTLTKDEELASLSAKSKKPHQMAGRYTLNLALNSQLGHKHYSFIQQRLKDKTA
ncbi:hypothetical protein GCM10026988_02440 [Vibrio panuliri]